MRTLLDREDLVFGPPPSGGVLSLSGLPGGGNKIYDRSPYGNAGMIIGATWKRLPGGLWCLSFDGLDDGVDCGTGSSLDITGDKLTLEAWVYVESWAGCDSYAYIMASYQPNVGGYGIARESTNNRFFFTVNVPGWSAVFPAGTQAEQTWLYMVGIYNGVTYKLFENAVEIAGASRTGNIGSTANAIRIGGNGVNNNFHGKIVLPRIHNRALSLFEMQNHFHQEKHLFGVW